MQAASVLSLNRWIAAGCHTNGAVPLYYQEADTSFAEEVRSSMQQLGPSQQAQHITYDKNFYERFRKCFARETWPSNEAKKKHFAKNLRPVQGSTDVVPFLPRIPSRV